MSPVLSIGQLELRRGEHRVLRGVSLDVAPGEICVLMGASGAGKSTILRCVAALEPFDAGVIQVDDVTLIPGSLRSQRLLAGLRHKVAMVFQSHALFEHLTAVENVMLAPRHVLGWDAARARTRAMELLAELGVEARASALPQQLSGGEAQRVAIARALIGDPSLLLLDEPTSALDPARRGVLATTLRTLASNGRAMLIATHDLDFAAAVSDRVLALRDGAVDSMR